MSLATWKIPENISASNEVDIEKRIKYYRFNMKHFLQDNTRIIPTIQTAHHVLDAYDYFGIELAIDKNSYVLYVNNWIY